MKSKFTVFTGILLLVICYGLQASETEQGLGPVLEGPLTQGALIRGYVAPGTRVSLNDEAITVSEDGAFVFGFGRDAETQQVLSWQVSGGPWRSRDLTLRPREYAIQYVEGVPQSTVSPSADKLARIREESAMVKKARETMTSRQAFRQDFVQPLEGPVTGVYGSQRVYNGTPKRPHYGVDYAAPVGTIVTAPADGWVTLVHQDMFYSGGTLIMDHGHGVSSTFIHLSEVLVREGQQVSQGDAIARVGQGGRATGPHLDWRMNWKHKRIDPQLVLELTGSKR